MESCPLVVVDMQHDFAAARDKDLCRRIEEAAAAHPGPLVHLQSDDCGAPTIDLPGVVSLWKPQDDGGDELYSYLIGAGFVQRHMKVLMCGVNTAACVYGTACGLTRRLRDEHGIYEAVDIVVSLCGDHNTRLRFVESIGV